MEAKFLIMHKEFNVEFLENTLRFKNWKEYIASNSICRPQKSKNVAVFVTYNLSNSALTTIECLSKADDLDIVVIDNNSTEVHKKNLVTRCENCENISLLLVDDNIGGAGGYAIGLEYILLKNYDYVLITEDDAELSPNTLVQYILENVNHERMTKIWFENNASSSFNFHWMVYPIKILREVGVPDPRYFMRSDDFEFGMRVKKVAKKLKINEVILKDYKYFHPIIKENKTVWMEYFSTRNSLESYSRNNLFFMYLMEPLKKIPYSIFKLMKLRDSSSLKIFFIALFDYILGRMSYEVNNSRKKMFISYKSFYPEMNYKNQTMQEFYGSNSSNEILLLGSSLKNVMVELPSVKSVGIKNSFKFDTCVLAGYFSPMLPVAYLFKKIIVIANVSTDNKSFSYFEINGHGFVNSVIFVLTLILSIFATLLTMPPLIIKYFLKKFSV